MMVYIAGPYTSDPDAGTLNAIDAAEQIAKWGHVPHVPHLYHFWHQIHPHPDDFWLELDRHYLKLCDVMVRLPGASHGADLEETWAAEFGIPVMRISELDGT